MNDPAVERGGPVPLSERIPSIDILRGFALFGILLVNMHLFGFPAQELLVGSEESGPLLDRIAAWGIQVFAESKFYPIFSFLFGLGFALQIQRAEARGTRFVPFYLRRLFILLLIGVAHAVFIWVGDILVLYALLGAILLLFFRKRSPRTLLVWTGVFLAVSVLLPVGLSGLALLAKLTPAGAAEVSASFAESEAGLRAEAAQATLVYTTGSFAEITLQRLSDLRLMYSVAIFLAFNAFAMFLLGLYVGRRGIFRNISAHVPLLKKIFWWGFALGASSNLAYAIVNGGSEFALPTRMDLLADSVRTIGAPALALSYIAGLTLLLQHDAWRARLGPLAAVGRMALTNYLLQSLVATTIFYGYGFGLFGQIGPALGVVLTVVIFTAQIPLSMWWMGRFQFGPVEWLWRTLTYLRWQPLRPASGTRR
ncbi:MAG: DUF418 domain-containing protein [Chloroflexi bacterium]|nr:DUF418 domain-containing protein [Chloroflexota bacterium]